MKYLSTRDKTEATNAREAVLEGLAPDGGLFIPTELPEIGFAQNASIVEIAHKIAEIFFGSDIPSNKLLSACESAFNFPTEIVSLTDSRSVLELFHGPTLAFKDYGARFMSRIISLLLEQKNSEVTILVATSGDTGGAVAQGFYEVPGVKVVLLYPKDKVSRLQRQQFTTLGKNISALEINGTFDDCQSMVKSAFLDQELTGLAAANSINIARLIPQSVYYWYSSLRLEGKTVFSIPSGNFGNLTAASYAKKMGAPIHQLIAPTNSNDTVPRFIQSGEYQPKTSVHTVSNAMDVGNPSNFTRMLKLDPNLRQHLVSDSFSDPQTLAELKRVYDEHEYIMCPHTSVASLGLNNYKESVHNEVVVATAHPAKFLDTVEKTLDIKISLPSALKDVADLPSKSVSMEPDFLNLKEYLKNVQ